MQYTEEIRGRKTSHLLAQRWACCYYSPCTASYGSLGNRDLDFSRTQKTSISEREKSQDGRRDLRAKSLSWCGGMGCGPAEKQQHFPIFHSLEWRRVLSLRLQAGGPFDVAAMGGTEMGLESACFGGGPDKAGGGFDGERGAPGGPWAFGWQHGHGARNALPSGYLNSA